MGEQRPRPSAPRTQVEPAQQPSPPSTSQAEQQVRQGPAGPASSGAPASATPASGPAHTTEQLPLSSTQPSAHFAHSASNTAGTQSEPPVKLLHVAPGPQSAGALQGLPQLGGFSQLTPHCASVLQYGRMPAQASQPVGKQRWVPEEDSEHFVPGQQSAWLAQVPRQQAGRVQVPVQAVGS